MRPYRPKSKLRVVKDENRVLGEAGCGRVTNTGAQCWQYMITIVWIEKTITIKITIRIITITIKL